MATIPQWVQTALFESNVIEVTLSVGIITSPDHVQLQVETRDPINGNLLDLWSNPHCQLDDLATALREALTVIAGHVQSNSVLTPYQHCLLESISDAAPPRC